MIICKVLLSALIDICMHNSPHESRPFYYSMVNGSEDWILNIFGTQNGAFKWVRVCGGNSGR